MTRHRASRPWLCRLGLHWSTFSDTTGTEIAPGQYALVTVTRCNGCLKEMDR